MLLCAFHIPCLQRQPPTKFGYCHERLVEMPSLPSGEHLWRIFKFQLSLGWVYRYGRLDRSLKKRPPVQPSAPPLCLLWLALHGKEQVHQTRATGMPQHIPYLLQMRKAVSRPNCPPGAPVGRAWCWSKTKMSSLWEVLFDHNAIGDAKVGELSGYDIDYINVKPNLFQMASCWEMSGQRFESLQQATSG